MLKKGKHLWTHKKLEEIPQNVCRERSDIKDKGFLVYKPRVVFVVIHENLKKAVLEMVVKG